MTSGLLLNDINDHLPVFVTYKCVCHVRKDTNTVKYRKARTEDTMITFRREIMRQIWRNAYQAENIDLAYNTFMELYEKHCPLQQYRMKPNCQDKPWITKGVLRACNKKNTLYKEFIKYRKRDKEIKHKRSKNKIDNIRKSSRNYYNSPLDYNKNNTKGTCRIINRIIRKNHSNYTESFIENEKEITNMKDVVEGFNNFFVKVGPNLAKKRNPIKMGVIPKH